MSGPGTTLTRLTAVCLVASLAVAAAQDSERPPTLWRVGPGHELKTPGEAARVARSGDSIEIEAGLYQDDYAYWHQDNLNIRAVGGYAHLQATKIIPNDKAIWVITGDNILVENIEFSGAKVYSTNGAGIRHNGGDLRLHNTYFHDNEFSIMTGPGEDADIQISDSRFWHQRRATRWSHGIYIGAVESFTLSGSHIMGTERGHQVKSRALHNRILYNRIEDSEGGDSSRLIDLPNCGFSLVMGNELHQGPYTDNTDVIGYGAEGCEQREDWQQQLYVLNNTLINTAMAATLVRNHSDGRVTAANNLLFGGGEFRAGPGEDYNNLRLRLPRIDHRDWAPPAGSAAIDAAVDVPSAEINTVPLREFHAPLGTRPRPVEGELDIGAREAPLSIHLPGL